MVMRANLKFSVLPISAALFSHLALASMRVGLQVHLKVEESVSHDFTVEGKIGETQTVFRAPYRIEVRTEVLDKRRWLEDGKKMGPLMKVKAKVFKQEDGMPDQMVESFEIAALNQIGASLGDDFSVKPILAAE